VKYFSLRFLQEKMRNPLYSFIGYDKSKNLAIVQDFTAHCAMKDEQMAQG
jgi:hypothetical protein